MICPYHLAACSHSMNTVLMTPPPRPPPAACAAAPASRPRAAATNAAETHTGSARSPSGERHAIDEARQVLEVRRHADSSAGHGERVTLTKMPPTTHGNRIERRVAALHVAARRCDSDESATAGSASTSASMTPMIERRADERQLLQRPRSPLGNSASRSSDSSSAGTSAMNSVSTTAGTTLPTRY